jgi:hypothetical protein
MDDTSNPVVISPAFVMLNLFQHNAPPAPVILKQVQDDEGLLLLRVGVLA